MADFAPRPEVSGEPKSKGKRYIWIALLIIAVLVILTYYYMSLPATPPLNNESSGQVNYTQEQIEVIANDSYPLMRNVILTNKPVVAGCIAGETNNLSVCDLLDTEKMKESCRIENRLYLIFTGDCEELKEFDVELGIQGICEGLDSGSCERLSGDNKIMCESLLESDVTKCISVSSSFDMSSENCQENVYEYRAVKENNIDHCNDIPTFYKKYQCKAFISGSCESFLHDVTNDWVYFSLSRSIYENYIDTSICGNIIQQEIRDQCYDTSINYLTAIRTIE